MSRGLHRQTQAGPGQSAADRHRPAGAGGCRTAGLRGRDRHHPPVPQVRGHHARRLPCAAQMKRKSAFFHRSRRFVRQNPKSKQPPSSGILHPEESGLFFLKGPAGKRPAAAFAGKVGFLPPHSNAVRPGEGQRQRQQPAGTACAPGTSGLSGPNSRRAASSGGSKVRRRILRLRGGAPPLPPARSADAPSFSTSEYKFI